VPLINRSAEIFDELARLRRDTFLPCGVRDRLDDLSEYEPTSAPRPSDASDGEQDEPAPDREHTGGSEGIEQLLSHAASSSSTSFFNVNGHTR